MKRQRGADFDVFYFIERSTQRDMGIYVGYYPGLLTREAGVADVQRQSGRVGDLSIEWLHWSKDGRHQSETLVRDFFDQSTPKAHKPLVLHIFIGAPSAQDVARMEAAAATLTLKRSR